ncbi:MAG: xanthine dehydrogenase small subunit [Paracoccaceae bacterium]
MAPRTNLNFILNDTPVSLHEIGASDTLLDFLRLNRNLTGTKEGCAEGDCGACTVLVGRRAARGLVYEAVNACIRLMPSLDGCHIVTIEHLSGQGGALHPVQQAMLDHHGSQCGFCTPGIVMSLYALWMDNPRPSVADIEVALQGNLCRCTGYAPILRAAKAASETGGQGMDALIAHRADMAARLAAMADGARVELSRNGQDRAIIPADVTDLAAVLAEHEKPTIVAGSTDVGLWITKHMRDISPAVFIINLAELQTITQDDTGLTLGGGVSYTDAAPALLAAYPQLAEFWGRIGGAQVRNMGTVGGNVANGSPIGDTPPLLIALGAELALSSMRGTRRMLVQDFFIEYGKQDRAPDEFVSALHIPPMPADALFCGYKVTKRRDEDISAVAAGFFVQKDGYNITSARLAYGGMAGTPMRAKGAEAALIGKPFSRESFAAAASAIARDFTPLSDWRASKEYRATLAANLLLRFYDQMVGEDETLTLRQEDVA